MNRTLVRAAKFENLASAYLSSWRHGTPAFVRMLPTDRCNLDCAYCWQRDERSADMTLAAFERYLAKALELRVGLITFLGGEPMIWAPLCDALALCTERRVLTDLTTNGTLLTPESIERLGRAGLDYLNISVDGAGTSAVTRKNSVFRPGLMEALKEARREHHLHARINSVVFKDNFHEIRTLIDFAERWDVQLSLGFVVPHIDPAHPAATDICFTPADEPRLREIVDEILARKRAGASIIDPDEYFRNVFRFLRRERFWDCNYPTRHGWINVTPTGRIRSCTKKMDELDIGFLELDAARLGELRALLKEKVAGCNLDCYSNCAYDSYFYTHNKGALLKKVLRRVVRRRRSG